jgi:hypothetical protein
VAEKENTERTGKEDSSKSSKESTTGEKPPVAEKLKTTEKKESNKIAKTSSKEKAA